MIRWCLVGCILLSGCNHSYNAAVPVEERRWQPFNRMQPTHVVNTRGETLYAVAFRYDEDYRQLAQLNHLSSPYTLRMGQVIRLHPQNGWQRVNAHPARPVARYQQPAHRIAPIAQQSPVYYRPMTGSGWIWPASGRIATGYIPAQGQKGIDIAGQKGDKIHASAAGTVAYAGSGLAGYGNLIIIKHNNQFLTAYGNNERNLVKEGQNIKAGQIIAEMGVVDRKFRGVHFEMRQSGQPVNPLNYLKKG